MIFYVDVPPALVPSQIGSYSSSLSQGRNAQAEDLRFGATRFISGSVGADSKEISTTPRLVNTRTTISHTPISRLKKDDATPASASIHQFRIKKEPEISKIAEDRIRLLAVKYASEAATSEIAARLEILNTRLAQRAPRVTLEQLSSLEESLNSIKSVEASRIERAKRLGLKI
jgi:hypothetical protein